MKKNKSDLISSDLDEDDTELPGRRDVLKKYGASLTQLLWLFHY